MFKHWKTTLAGVLLAVVQVVAAGAVDVKTISVAACTALLGMLAKDK